MTATHRRNAPGHRLAGLAALAALTLLAGTAVEAQEETPEAGYVLVGPEGGAVRNLYNKNGIALAELRAGDVLATHGREADWLEVEVPGGVPVWVYGRFLRTTDTPGLLEVTGNNVFQRPRPSGDTSSFPLRQKLYVRDRLTMIGRHDMSVAFEEDWIQVWSSVGTRVWIAESETAAVPADASGSALWADAVMARRHSHGTSAAADASAVEAGARTTPGTATGDQALEALRGADALFAAEKTKPAPDFPAVRAAYEGVIAMGGDEVTVELAQSKLRAVQAFEEVLALQAENAALIAAHDERMRNRDAAIAEAGQRKDPFQDRFLERGWLERADRANADSVYVLTWDGARRAEVICESGRYDLELFVGFEIGLRGRQLFGSNAIGTGLVPNAPVLDATRIEILSGRSESNW